MAPPVTTEEGNFVHDLNLASEAWFSYSEDVQMSSYGTPPKIFGTAHRTFISAFMYSRGWRMKQICNKAAKEWLTKSELGPQCPECEHYPERTDYQKNRCDRPHARWCTLRPATQSP